MWHAALLRLLRRRIVLAVIFCLSLTYFLVNLFGNVSVDIHRPRFLVIKKKYIKSHSQGVSLSKDFDEVVYTRQQPLIWREESRNATLNDVVPPNCRNSIQGKTLIVDDEGYVCPRIELLNTGCCKLAPQSKQYDCESCIEDGCCSVYEYCVSCCLNPDKVSEIHRSMWDRLIFIFQ